MNGKMVIALGFGLSVGIGALVLGATAAERTTKGSGLGTAESGSSSRKIDKTCLMVCERWTDDGCAKWVMRCKGDPGYPSGLLFSQ